MKRPFKIINQDDPERCVISYDEGNANIYLIKTDQGFIIDIYDKTDEHIHSATIWDDDLNIE